jgi:chromosome segregation ATPase
MAGGDRAAREAQLVRIAEAEEGVRALQQGMAQVREAQAAVEAEIATREQEQQAAQDAVGTHEAAVGRIRGALAQAQRDDGSVDRMAVFGRATSAVLRDIEQAAAAGKWRGMRPVGPLGRHLRLRDPRYEAACESLLGRLANSFAVDNHQDRALLASIFARHRHSQNADIYVAQRRAIDWSQGEPDPSFTTALRVLEVDNEVALHQLIINNHIEKTILVPTRAEGHRVTEGGLPHNANTVITADLYSMGSRGGGYTSQTMNRWNAPKRLGGSSGDLEAYVAEQREKLTYAQRQLQDAQAAAARFAGQLSELRGRRVQLRAQLAELERDLGRRQLAVTQERDRLTRQEGNLNLADLQEQREAARQAVAGAKAALEALEAQRAQLREAEQGTREAIGQVERELRHAAAQREEYLRNAGQAQRSRAAALADAALLRGKEEEARALAEGAAGELEAMAERVTAHVAAAQQVCERMPLERRHTVAALERKVEALEERIRARARECVLFPAFCFVLPELIAMPWRHLWEHVKPPNNKSTDWGRASRYKRNTTASWSSTRRRGRSCGILRS